MAIFGRFNGLGIGQAIQNRNEREMANRNAAFNSLSSGFQRMFDKMEEDKLRREALKREDALRAQERRWNVMDQNRNRAFQRKMNDRNLLGNILAQNIAASSAFDASMAGKTRSKADAAVAKSYADRTNALAKELGLSFEDLAAIGLVPKAKPVASTLPAMLELNTSLNPELQVSPAQNIGSPSVSDEELYLEDWIDLMKSAQNDSDRDDVLRRMREANIDMADPRLVGHIGNLINAYEDANAHDRLTNNGLSDVVKLAPPKTRSEGDKTLKDREYNKRVSSAREGVIKNKKLPAEAYTNGVLNEFGKSIIKSGTIESGGDSYTLQWLFDNGFLK